MKDIDISIDIYWRDKLKSFEFENESFIYSDSIRTTEYDKELFIDFVNKSKENFENIEVDNNTNIEFCFIFVVYSNYKCLTQSTTMHFDKVEEIISMYESICSMMERM